ERGAIENGGGDGGRVVGAEQGRRVIEEQGGQRGTDAAAESDGPLPAEPVADDAEEEVPDDVAEEHGAEELEPLRLAEADDALEVHRQKDEEAELRSGVD